MGSVIRIIGHTQYLREFNFDVDFYNPYEIVPEKFKRAINPIKIRYPIILDHILRFYAILPKLRRILKVIILQFSVVKKSINIENPIIFHQNYNLGYFLYKEFNKRTIYDIHGVLSYQREYLKNKPFLEKIVFYLNLLKESLVFQDGNFFIAPSKELRLDLKMRFNIPEKKIFVGRDGFLRSYKGALNPELMNKLIKKYNPEKKFKLILFIGAFKRFGGIWDLVRSFNLLQKDNSNLRLLLVGGGQEEERIKRYVKEECLQGKIFLSGGYIPYEQITTYHKISHLIVCPDTTNRYNQLNPHIKLYDSFASGKPVLFSYFPCLRHLSQKMKGFETFKPGDISDLKEKMQNIINDYSQYKAKANENPKLIEKLSYKEASAKLMEDFKDVFHSM